jgi:hypothetical protein
MAKVIVWFMLNGNLTKGGRGMNRSNTAIFTLLVIVFSSTGFAQSGDPIAELKACARITDRDARLSCLDELGERVLREESADKAPAKAEVPRPETASAAKQSNVQPLPDDLGKSNVGENEEDRIKYTGTVKSCQEGRYGDWYFIFENGQVWKDVSDRRLRFDECKFDVTITEDFFGYKMRIDALDKTIAVRRYK